jgi:hypothetical protein
MRDADIKVMLSGQDKLCPDVLGIIGGIKFYFILFYLFLI